MSNSPKTSKRQIRLDLDAEVHRRLRVVTAEKEMTARAAIRQAIREWLDRMTSAKAA